MVVDSGSLLLRADLKRPISENARRLAQLVVPTEYNMQLQDHSVFYREALPPGNHYAKAVVVLLHGQSYSSSTWIEQRSLQTFAAQGYHCIAPDLPGSGKTKGPAISNEDKPTFLLNFLSALGVKQVMLVAASMSSLYVLPLLQRDVFSCVVGIALSNTHDLKDVHRMRTPILCLHGDRDTSLGPTSAVNLKALPYSRSEKIPSAGHACYLGNPEYFETLCVNFFELIRSYHQF